MKRNHSSFFFRLLLSVFALFCSSAMAWAATEVHVDKAGTLSTLLTTSEKTLKITGSINGTDIKYLRELISAGTVTDLNLSEDDYWWYLNLRKYGGTKHAGYGLGFERIIMYLTGVSNIRDVIPYPRTVGNAEY